MTALLRSLLPYLRRYRLAVAAGLACVILGNLFQLSGPQFLRFGIDAISAGASTGRVVLFALGMLGAAVLTGAARFAMRQLLNGVSRRVEYDVRNDLYGHLQRLEPAFYHRTPTGDLMALSTNDLGAVRMVAGPAVMYATETITRVAMALPLMAGIDWRLTSLALVPMLGVPVAIVAVGPLIERRFTAVQEHFATLSTFVHENLSGVRVVRAYRQEAPQTERFRTHATEYLHRNIALARAWAALFPLVTLIGGVGSVITLWYGGLLVLRGTVTIGDYVAFVTYLGMLVWPMIAMGWVINLFQRGAASMARIRKVLETAPTIADPASPRHLAPGTQPRMVEFRDVWFRYPAKRRPDGPPGDGDRGWALEAISFTAPAGAWIAVVGATGAGKSTLVELIPRLADPERGTVLVDGIPVGDVALADLRRAVGFVPQDTFLFSQTIGENIGLEERPAVVVEDSARVAQLHETVTGFPDGYGTMLGERGINLSGGQKQRTAIARALALDPPILVLDDALSSVDTETEAAILHGLRAAVRGKTAIVVSHRITAIRDADLILVLDEGKLVETGRHEELFAKRGRYWELLRRQEIEEQLRTTGDEVMT